MIHTDEDDEFDRIARENAMKGQPYHFQKREWVGLTDEEIAECAERMEASDPTDSFWREFVRAIEAKLKEKNEKT
jgi:hypothetical protein